MYQYPPELSPPPPPGHSPGLGLLVCMGLSILIWLGVIYLIVGRG